MLFPLVQQLSVVLFRLNVDPFHLCFAAPLYNLVPAAQDPLGGQREVDFEAQVLKIKAIQNLGFLNRLPADHLIRHAVHRPVVVWDIGYSQRL